MSIYSLSHFSVYFIRTVREIKKNDVREFTENDAQMNSNFMKTQTLRAEAYCEGDIFISKPFH